MLFSKCYTVKYLVISLTAIASSSRVKSSVLGLPTKFHASKTFPFQNEGLGQRVGSHLKQNGARMVELWMAVASLWRIAYK